MKPVNHHSAVIARIGPNAIIRVAEAVHDQLGAVVAQQLFNQAQLAAYLHTPPDSMVDEKEVIRLQQVLRAELGLAVTRQITRDAGTRTGHYLLARRIPKPAQRLLKLLPAVLAARLLVKAIKSNAWTFSGSGIFSAQTGHPVLFTLENCPICRGAIAETPLCDYYAATFECLFRELVSRHTQVTETACQALGAAACVFQIQWR